MLTHDELLQKLEQERKFLQQYIDGEDFTVLHALRAVVELHKPEEYGGPARCPVDGSLYPCSTIQAIEKELV